MDFMKLNVRQSIFVVLFIIIVLPMLGFLIAKYTGSTFYIPFLAVILSWVGANIAKKYI
ncbi:Uncharacterised protein [Mycobacteroides abscessus subsp. abscessus]|nr:Uncharacterised protein [Mycobacteroides abscessus subsp. abscessus]